MSEGRQTESRAGGELTVVIPSWNGRELLKDCLRSLHRQTRPCRILVVDDGSTDGTEEMVKTEFPGVEVLRSERNLGFARSVNRGLVLCRSEFVALLNNDTIADPAWVETGCRAFARHPEYSFFASKMIDASHPERIDGAGDRYGREGLPLKRGNGKPVEDYRRDEEVLGASAGAAFYRASLFDEIGLLDEDYTMYLEDVDLSLRARLSGHRCLFLHQAIIVHREAASDPLRGQAKVSGNAFYSPKRVFWITRNRWQLMWTYQPFRHLPWLLVGWGKSALFHLVKAGYFSDFLRGSWAGLTCLGQALRKRRRLRRGMKISERELCRLLRES